jgi:hypothetical protein
MGLTQPSIQRVLTAVSPGGNGRPGREADHSTPSSADVRNGGAILPFPMRLHGIVLN